MARVVLVTGVSRPIGGSFARALAADSGIERVLGLDVAPPQVDPEEPVSFEFVRADIRSPAIGRLLAREEVDTVVHLGAVPAPPGSSRAVAKETNVIGSMQLLAACQKLPSLKQFVLRSSTAVYGASGNDPAMFTEDMEPRRLPQSGYAKDALEVERYVRGFGRRRPDVLTTTLRFTSLLGPGVSTALTTYLTLPMVPTVLGFDPRLQFTHPDDVVDALRAATVGEVSGVVNVSGDGVLALSQALRRLGRPQLPVPGFAMRPLGAAYRAGGLPRMDTDQLDFLTYGRGVDTTRMRAELKFDPGFTSEDALAAFADTVQPGALNARRIRTAERRIADRLGVRG